MFLACFPVCSYVKKKIDKTYCIIIIRPNYCKKKKKEKKEKKMPPVKKQKKKQLITESHKRKVTSQVFIAA